MREGGGRRSYEIKYLREVSKVNKGSKSAKLESVNGKYAFFTASRKSPKRINEYSYDTKAIFFSHTFHFLTFLYEGKFEVSDNCYVILLTDNSLIYPFFEEIKRNIPIFQRGTPGGNINYFRINQLLKLKLKVPNQIFLNKFNIFYESIQLKIESLNKNIEKFEKIKNDLFTMIFNQKIQIN